VTSAPWQVVATVQIPTAVPPLHACASPFGTFARFHSEEVANAGISACAGLLWNIMFLSATPRETGLILPERENPGESPTCQVVLGSWHVLDTAKSKKLPVLQL
jgi:hypothetical protein